MSEIKYTSYLRYSWFLIGMVFLVILAGGVVRMTQSGMGCPDWPTCFGMWIPPTESSQLPADFEKYLSKQDIDHSFNAYHTWIEYINRLLGALLGVFILVYLFWSIRLFWQNRKDMVLVAFLLLIAVGVEGWLGKVVVDENLSVVKITVHMLGALIIASLPLYNIVNLRERFIQGVKGINGTIMAMLLALIIQIVFGTQVREEIDLISKSFNYEQRELWIAKLGVMFTIHRSFSWIIILGTIYLFFLARKSRELLSHTKQVLILVGTIVCLGIVMAYCGMPAVAQPLHLLLSSILLVKLIYFILVIDN